MKTTRFALALVPALALAACNQAATTPEPAARPGSDTVLAESASPPASPASELATPAADSINGGYPALTPPVLTPEAEKGVTGARNFLLAFARAIERKAFDQAWTLLSPGDKQKWSRPGFAKMFADLRKITVATPDGTSEGAAGSIYYTSPIAITATDKQSRPIRIAGEAVLRRVNDVDGATPAQLRWHFDHLTLDRAH